MFICRLTSQLLCLESAGTNAAAVCHLSACADATFRWIAELHKDGVSLCLPVSMAVSAVSLCKALEVFAGWTGML
jgi:hypothetical protein